MGNPDDFARACREAARALRRVPTVVRRDLNRTVQTHIAEPLAADIRGATGGPWATTLSTATRARAAGDPQIVIGGTRPRLSGGASPRQIVFGTEFGAGRRVTSVPARPGRRGYRRVSTVQFHSHHTPFVFPTVGRRLEDIFSTWADLVGTLLDGEVPQ